MFSKIADVGVAFICVAGILVLTRPGSKGPALVGAITGGFANITRSATGQRPHRAAGR